MRERFSIAVTVFKAVQISPDSWRTKGITKIFEEGSSLTQIMEWAWTFDKGATFSELQITDLKN